MKKILVVGAGFAGATMARKLAEAGMKILVIDRRPHIAGNAYDYRTEDGTRIHLYGPHLWHTSNQKVQDWVSQFTEWTPHFHWVEALLNDGQRVPLPVNWNTVETIFASQLIQAYGPNYVPHIHIPEFLETLRRGNADEASNGRELMEAKIGTELTELFFARYTKKMWGMDLSELPASIAARVGARENMDIARNNGYFNDTYQAVPKDGYEKLVSNMLEHDNITVLLGTDRLELSQFGGDLVVGDFEDPFHQVFTSEALDEMYNCDLGPLKWRSIKMHTQMVPMPKISDAPVTNFTNTGPFTRVTEWKNIPGHEGSDPNITWITTEEPCDYTDNHMERYYPVKSVGAIDENRELWKKYNERAIADGFIPIGRVARYLYLDMHQVISSTMAQADEFLKG